MSTPRYDWWGYAKGMIRRYPSLAEARREGLPSAGVSAATPVPGQGDISRPAEVLALRPASTADRECEAVRRAIATTRRMHSGDERLRLIELVFWHRTHTLEGAAQCCHVSYRLAARWHGEFVRLVASYFGLMD